MLLRNSISYIIYEPSTPGGSSNPTISLSDVNRLDFDTLTVLNMERNFLKFLIE
jgi:hypothetical protein